MYYFEMASKVLFPGATCCQTFLNVSELARGIVIVCETLSAVDYCKYFSSGDKIVKELHEGAEHCSTGV